MDEKGFDYMNVIPLVDVMMVLLAIVLMTSTFIAGGLIPVALPQSTQERQQLLKNATITIDERNRIYFESEPTNLGGLGAALEKLGRETPIVVKANRHLPVQDCVDVLDLLAGKGFQKVALQTERKSG
jgi:biopolymer transport protein ExbD